jgi:hypothetical protein
MNDASEWLVGGVAIALALWIGISTVLQSPGFYRLRRVAEIRDRFGNRNAAVILLGVAALLLGTGMMILGGIRPGYAMPTNPAEPRVTRDSGIVQSPAEVPREDPSEEPLEAPSGREAPRAE